MEFNESSVILELFLFLNLFILFCLDTFCTRLFHETVFINTKASVIKLWRLYNSYGLYNVHTAIVDGKKCGKRKNEFMYICVRVRVCVCVKEIEIERTIKNDKKREWCVYVCV